MGLVTKREYVSYLINTYSNYTCSGLSELSEHTEGANKVSHDAVSNFLKSEKLIPSDLWKLVSPRINNATNGFLIVDDSVQDKRYSISKISGS